MWLVRREPAAVPLSWPWWWSGMLAADPTLSAVPPCASVILASAGLAGTATSSHRQHALMWGLCVRCSLVGMLSLQRPAWLPLSN